jgi:hypothetical protein
MKQGDCCASTLGAMVLFISTALLSQIVHLKLESKRRKEDRVLNMRSIYKTKRLADRLSYTDVTALNKGPARKSLRLSNGMDVLQPPTADVSIRECNVVSLVSCNNILMRPLP